MSMSPNASKELKRILWIFAGSFFLMPAVLWLLVVGNFFSQSIRV